MDYETIDEYRSSVKERLARIESILQRELPDIKEQLKISNGRTRSLENWRNYILGGMAIIIFLFTNLKTLEYKFSQSISTSSQYL